LASIFEVAAVRRPGTTDNPFVTGELQIVDGTLLIGVLCVLAIVAHVAFRSWVLGLLVIAQFLVNYWAVRIRTRPFVARVAMLVALCLPSAMCGVVLVDEAAPRASVRPAERP
jgi:4-hydroxybenzoate polyprenyltransferase